LLIADCKTLEKVQLAREFGITEIVFMLAFAFLYVLYITRVIRVARSLKTPYSGIFIKVALRSLYFLLFVVALLGPSFGGSKKEVKSIGKDIMFCIDLSKSMDAYDIQPTRLEKVKFEIKRIVEAFAGDRIGVIIFSSEAYVQCPLTYDQNALHLFIDAMSSRLVPSTGTDFGPPLSMALKKLNETDGPASQAKSKVIVLISDGEDFGEETEDMADEIEDKGIKLFTLGVGTEKGGNILVGNQLKKDRNGRDVVTKLNAKSLQRLSDITGGEYFEINDTRNDVNRLISTIERIEGDLRGTKVLDVTTNKYYYFLLAAVVLMLIDIFINVTAIRI
jgi:Ca-activated chloride channel homolog